MAPSAPHETRSSAPDGGSKILRQEPSDHLHAALVRVDRVPFEPFQFLARLANVLAPISRHVEERGFLVLGELAEPALRQVLTKNPGPEARRRVEAILTRQPGPVTQPELLRSLRAVAVLEDISTPSARKLLEHVSQGAPEARLTREAKAALQRLEQRITNP